jgi:hypothetical protein
MGLYLLIPTFLVILASILVVRAGAIALRMTGLDDTTARFQAMSAFTRAGFTTRESELVMGHTQRRRIITWLIVLGNAGIVAVIVTGTSSLTTSSDYRLAINIGALILGIYILSKLARHTGLTSRWEKFVERTLVRWRLFGSAPSVEHLLRFGEGYGIVRVPVPHLEGATDETLRRTGFYGTLFIVLGVEQQGQWIPRPPADLELVGGEVLTLFGNLTDIERTFGRVQQRYKIRGWGANRRSDRR